MHVIVDQVRSLCSIQMQGKKKSNSLFTSMKSNCIDWNGGLYFSNSEFIAVVEQTSKHPTRIKFSTNRPTTIDRQFMEWLNLWLLYRKVKRDAITMVVRMAPFRLMSYSFLNLHSFQYIFSLYLNSKSNGFTLHT